jgi:hypothetical protein
LNLGPKVNSAGREHSPRLVRYKNRTYLFFASESGSRL